MSKETVLSALDSITDHNWNPFGLFLDDYEGSLQPEFITPLEANIYWAMTEIIFLCERPLKSLAGALRLSQLHPDTLFPNILPALVRQFAHIEGADKFKEIAFPIQTGTNIISDQITNPAKQKFLSEST